MSDGYRLIITAISMMGVFVAPGLAAPNEAANVQKTVIGLSAAWNQHDMVAFGKLFASDAEFVNVVGQMWKGRDEIQINHAWAHGTIPLNTSRFENAAAQAHYGIFKNSTLQFTHIDVRFLRKDIAVAHVDCELFGDARTKDPRRTVLLLVLSRQGSTWLIAVAQNTEIDRKVH
jgi:ketosteroid isomerase-like protein